MIRSSKPQVRLVAQPRKRPISGNVVNRDRNLDLRASRRFRVGELVWCALSPPIHGDHVDECIEFWPGLVNEVRLKTDVLPHSPGSAWNVVQSTVYKVKLLGITHSYVLPEVAALPYQAYGASTELIERLRLSGNPALLQDRQQLSDFHPIPVGIEVQSGPQAQFVDAATPFALAIQIAAHLVRMWTPTDEWKFHGEVPTAATSASAPSTTEVHETRYQGLWWGAERIWVDELVRLQPARAQVMPQGSSVIKRASPRADARGVLMRINAVIAMSEGAGKDRPRDCKVAGFLYELADDSYEEEPSEAFPADDSVSADVTEQHVSPSQTAPDNLAVTVELFQTRNSDNIHGPVVEASPAQIIPSKRPVSESSTSLPNPSLYPLPKPPNGFKFRPIMKTGSEIVLDASLIAGRYYPELLNHPYLQNALATVDVSETRTSQLVALCSLLPGAVNSMECVDWASTRLRMIQHADITAHEDLFQHWHPADVEMVVMDGGEGEGEGNDIAKNPEDVS